MTKRNTFRQWQRYITVIFVVWLIQTNIGQVIGQEKPKENLPPQDSNTTLDPTTPTDDKNKPADNSTTSTEATQEADIATPEVTPIRPVRVKAEQPLYFLAQFVSQYDDNVMLRQKSRVGNIVLIPQIGFGAKRVTPRSQLKIDYLGGIEVHQHFREFNGATHSLTAAAEYDLTKRSTVFVNNSFNQRPLVSGFEVFDLPILLANAITPLEPTKSVTNSLLAGISYQLSKSSEIRTGYTYSVSRFNNPKLINSDEHRLEVDYTKRLNQKYSYDILYQGSVFLDQSTQKTHTLIPSLTYRHKNSLRVRFGAGPQAFFSPIDDRHLFLATLTQVNYQTAKTVYTMSFTTGIGRGGGLATVSNNRVLFGTIDHSFTSKLRLETRIGYSRSKNGFLSPTNPLLRLDFVNTELIINNRINYLMSNRTEVFFDYTHSTQKGSGAFVRNVSRNVFSLGLRFDTRNKTPEPREKKLTAKGRQS